MMTMFIILGAWSLYRWYRRPSWRWAMVAGLLCGLAVLVKATAIFMVAGAIAGLALGDRGLRKSLRDPQMWLVGALTLFPAVVYHLVGLATGYLQPGLFDMRILPSMLLQPVSYLRWEIKTDQVVGIGAALLALAGTFLAQARHGRALLFGMWASYFAYGAVFIYFFTTHDYYQLPLIPLVALGLSPLGQAIFDRMQSLWSSRWAYLVILSLLLAGALVNAWNIRTTLKKNDYRGEAAFWQGLAQELRGYKVVALSDDYNHRLSYFGLLDVPYLLSYGDMNLRKLAGHPVDAERMYYIQKLEGRDFFLITMLDELNLQPVLKEVLYSRYKLYKQGERYLIFDLRHPQ
jgi:4-amino-4-deoxy-L-arabinose transferase-like glycosyltransferase